MKRGLSRFAHIMYWILQQWHDLIVSRFDAEPTERSCTSRSLVGCMSMQQRNDIGCQLDQREICNEAKQTIAPHWMGHIGQRRATIGVDLCLVENNALRSGLRYRHFWRGMDVSIEKWLDPDRNGPSQVAGFVELSNIMIIL